MRISPCCTHLPAGIVIIVTCLCATYAVMDVHKLKPSENSGLTAPLISES